MMKPADWAFVDEWFAEPIVESCKPVIIGSTSSLVVVCAWCEPHRIYPPDVRVSHTICPACLARELAHV